MLPEKFEADDTVLGLAGPVQAHTQVFTLIHRCGVFHVECSHPGRNILLVRFRKRLAEPGCIAQAHLLAMFLNQRGGQAICPGAYNFDNFLLQSGHIRGDFSPCPGTHDHLQAGQPRF